MATASQLRILVSDPPTPAATPIFPDAHYDTIGSMEMNLYKAAGNAARSLAAYFAQKVTVTAGPVKIESSDKAEHYLKIAKQYDDLSKSTKSSEIVGGGVVTGVFISEMTVTGLDTDRYDSVFYRGLDNQQEDGNGF